MVYTFFSKIKSLIPRDDEVEGENEDITLIQGISKHSVSLIFNSNNTFSTFKLKN